MSLSACVFVSVCMNVYVYAYVSISVCVYYTHAHKYTHMHTRIHTCIQNLALTVPHRANKRYGLIGDFGSAGQRILRVF